MYRGLKIAVLVPCYNEETLAAKTIDTVPEFVDKIVAINDGSVDDTLKVLRQLEKHNKRLDVLDNGVNEGLGKSLLNAFEFLQDTDIDAMGIMAGDAQMDPEYLSKLLDVLVDEDIDVAKANRFSQFHSVESMPSYRRIGNIVVSILTKFATGYYKLFDSLNGYVVYRKSIIDKIPKDIIGHRYEYENTMLVALSIVGAKIHDVPVPAVYGEETSTINLFGTTFKTLKVLNKGFWKRIYYKYVLYSFHPIALFLFSGLFASIIGLAWAIFILYAKIFQNISPSTGTVMLVVLPLILGFQLILTAIIMDVNYEDS
jgi:glycosyltransferase involved in cell wall biosynthesis